VVTLIESAPSRALAVYAHPDDADVSCGGTLARWARSGAEVHVAICTTGDKGTSDPRTKPAELARCRAQEAAEAAERLGLTELHQLGHSDGELEERALRAELVELVRSVRPETVLCPDPTAVFFGEDYFNHHDHRVVGFALLDSVSPAAALPLYFPEAGAAHQVDSALMSGTLEPNVWVDVSSTIDDKVAAVSCHRTQFLDGGEWAGKAVRLRAEEDGQRAGVAFAEGFRRLRLGA
jgi:LmbE family N-acetylglucosaminyl deacetylase